MKKAQKIRSIYQKFYFCLKSLISVACAIIFSKFSISITLKTLKALVNNNNN